MQTVQKQNKVFGQAFFKRLGGEIKYDLNKLYFLHTLNADCAKTNK